MKATFFILGSNVDARKDVVKRMYEEGHYLANHGYSHTYSNIYSTPQSVLDEYNECNDKVKNAIEVPDYNSHLFRFPGGLAGGKYAEIKKEAKELLLQNNIVNIDWNALTGDAETNNLSVEFEMSRLAETTELYKNIKGANIENELTSDHSYINARCCGKKCNSRCITTNYYKVKRRRI